MAKYIRIGEPANEAEVEGFRLLREKLPEHYRILGNFDLRLEGRRSSLEFDAVVIGEYGFFAVEIKGWTGAIRGGDRDWYLSWGRVSNPLNHLEKKTKALGQFIRGRVADLPDGCFCAPVVFFPREGVTFEFPESIGQCVLGRDDVYEYFVDMEMVRERGPGPLRSEKEIEAVVDAIVSWSEPREVHGILPTYYHVEGQLDVPDRPYREFVGSHLYLKSRSKVRIKAYTMDALATRGKARQEQNRILRDLEALEVLANNPYVARSYEMQPDQDDDLIFYLVSEWVGPRTLANFLHEARADEESREEIWDQRMRYSRHLIEAVYSIHKSGIIHRNLSPGVIYLTTGDAPVPLKIADFDFARVAKLETIAGALTSVGTEGYRAPELWLDQDYDSSVDLFSLGAILYELWTCDALLEGPGDLLRLDDTWSRKGGRIESEEIRAMIRSLIDPEPRVRKGVIEELRRAFRPLTGPLGEPVE